jgi:PAS domain S-box-containing protein
VQPGLEEKLHLLVEASATLLGCAETDAVLPAILQLARRLNAAKACAMWQFAADETEWRIASAVGLSSEFASARITRPFESTIDLAPYCFPDVESDPRVEHRRELYRRDGIGSVMAVPMRVGGRLSGTLTFYYAEPRQFSDAEVRVAEALATLALAAIDTSELHRERERARVRSAFLAEASATLSSSLDYETTLAAVASLAVPQVADWCAVEIVQHDGTLREVALAHADPAKLAQAQELRRKYPPDPSIDRGSFRILRTGKSDLRGEITPAMLARIATTEEHLDLMQGLGFTSYMGVPLTIRGHVLGVMSFVSSDPARRFGPEDLAVAEDLAGRAATAIDNALLYASAHRERTALEAALAALRENDDRLRLALEAGRMGTWDWNISTGELEWSENLLAMHGLNHGEFDFQYQSFLSVIHPEDRAAFEAAVDRALQERSSFDVEFRVVYRDGSIHWMAGKGRVFSNERGEAVRMIGLGMDVTDRRRLEDQVRKSQKLESIGLLAGGIAHDFNNLLTGVLGNASLASDLLPAESEAIPLIENVVRAGERAADLTQQLLAYSGKGRFVVKLLDLSELVREIANLVLTTIPKMVRLDLELDSSLPPIEADSSQVQQVVMNLVINAGEAIGDRRGRVLVRTGLTDVDEEFTLRLGQEELRAGRYVFLEVIDDGSGMDEQTTGRIFDPFFTTKFTGRGLGLSAVSGIVRSHRGAIDVSSEPGRGSTFRVLFPAAGAKLSAERPAVPAEEELRGAGLVLVIDDEEPVRTAAAAALRRYGYTVELAVDGADGIAKFRRAPESYRAVLLDLTMPMVSGEAALREIREIRTDIPVIASSGYSEVEASRRFPAGALGGFLQKPYTGVALAMKLKAVLPHGLVHKHTQS